MKARSKGQKKVKRKRKEPNYKKKTKRNKERTIKITTKKGLMVYKKELTNTYTYSNSKVGNHITSLDIIAFISLLAEWGTTVDKADVGQRPQCSHRIGWRTKPK